MLSPPLQALIKDYIESFHEQVANYEAVDLSGYLSPSERVAAIEKVANGDADILYLAPESLRSNTVFNLLKNRVIERFVIDEAHCLSTWGNDFRHDYFYIGQFINELLTAKPFESHIPVFKGHSIHYLFGTLT
ncbi:DEAD/DEAH box helicase [Sulfurimonas indica]|uniref:DEAD/DEAH box helicase n=1 Tax=Sulfurimonas indica TaxID=2508707 RepID=UPI001265A002|nr:DEAD/DEAH box helicase [Sulfurimonas indica]